MFLRVLLGRRDGTARHGQRRHDKNGANFYKGWGGGFLYYNKMMEVINGAADKRPLDTAAAGKNTFYGK